MMERHSYFQRIGILLSLLSTHSALSMSIEKIAKTYELLSPLYKHLSIAHGAAVAESNLLRNYYDFGNMENPTKGQWLAPGDGPIRLIHALWTLAGNNFLPSNNLSYPAAHIQPTTVGHIIAFLEKWRLGLKKPDAHSLEKVIINEPSFVESITSTDKIKEEINDRYQQEINKLTLDSKNGLDQTNGSKIKQLQEERSKELCRHDTSRLFKTIIHMKKKREAEEELKTLEKLTGQALQKEKKHIRQLKDKLVLLTTTNVTGDCNRLLDLAQAILDACEFSPHYPPYIAYAILQAFLYKKARHKEDILTYYCTLYDQLGAQIFYPYGLKPQSWLNARFFNQDLRETKNEITKYFNKNPKQALLEVLHNWYEPFLYAQTMTRFYRGSLPKKPELFNVQFKGIIYPDCTETTLRYLCNVHFYNPEIGIFDIPTNLLDKIDPQLKSFYNQDSNNQATSVDLPEVHQQWADILVNRDLITYKSMLFYSDSGEPITCSPPEGTDGFVRLPPEIAKLGNTDFSNKIWIGSHQYVLVDNDNVKLFKVAPTLRNIIIGLNELLGLKLLNSLKDYLSPNFDATYFPQLCNLIKPLQMLKLKPLEILTLDQRDYSPEGLRLQGENAELTLLMNHAEFTVHGKQMNIYPFGPHIIDELITSKSSIKDSHLMHLYSLVADSPDDLPVKLRYPLLYYFNLQHPEEKINILKKYLNPKNFNQSKLPIQQLILSAASKIMSSLPIRIDWIYQKKCIDTLEPETLSNPIITSVIERWKKIGLERLESKDLDFAADFFATLVDKGKDYEDGINVARTFITKITPNIDPGTELLVKESALNLYHSLAQKGKFHVEALFYADLHPDLQISKDIKKLVKN